MRAQLVGTEGQRGEKREKGSPGIGQRVEDGETRTVRERERRRIYYVPLELLARRRYVSE